VRVLKTQFLLGFLTKIDRFSKLALRLLKGARRVVGTLSANSQN
jgi:hypothetical protein